MHALSQENGDDVGLDQVLGLTGCVSGMLTVTIVSAKNIPKLDTFTESDPYAVLIIEVRPKSSRSRSCFILS